MRVSGAIWTKISACGAKMMLETLIYFRIWAVTVRFARFGCSKLATISRIQQTQKTDAYKKPAELRSSSTGLC